MAKHEDRLLCLPSDNGNLVSTSVVYKAKRILTEPDLLWRCKILIRKLEVTTKFSPGMRGFVWLSCTARSAESLPFIPDRQKLIFWERWRTRLLTGSQKKNYLGQPTRELVALEPRRPPMTNVGTETAFRLDQRQHFQKSKHLLRSEVSWCDQTSIDLHLRRSTCTSTCE